MIFLQTDSNIIALEQLELNWIALTVSIVVNAAIVGIMIWQYGQNNAIIKESSKARYAELLQEFDREIMEKETHQVSLKTSDDFVDYAIHYVNISNRMAHLYDAKYISLELISYFDPVFEKALAFLEWIETVDHDKNPNDSWNLVRKYCTDNSILPDHEGIQHFVDDFTHSSV